MLFYVPIHHIYLYLMLIIFILSYPLLKLELNAHHFLLFRFDSFNFQVLLISIVLLSKKRKKNFVNLVLCWLSFFCTSYGLNFPVPHLYSLYLVIPVLNCKLLLQRKSLEDWLKKKKKREILEESSWNSRQRLQNSKVSIKLFLCTTQIPYLSISPFSLFWGLVLV